MDPLSITIPDPDHSVARRFILIDLDMRPHYDFAGGVRGKYVDRFADDCTVVVLEPDVAEVFPDATSVNDTLRRVIASRGRGSSTE